MDSAQGKGLQTVYRILRIAIYYILLSLLVFTMVMPLFIAYTTRTEIMANWTLAWDLFARNFLVFAFALEAVILLFNRQPLSQISLLRIFSFKPTRETDLYYWMYFTAVYYYLPIHIAQSPYLRSIFPIFDLGAWGGEVFAFFFLSFTAFIIHWLSHKIPALWELHKIHHSATELTCITGPREHLLFEMIHIGIFVLFFNTQNMLVSLVFASRAFLNVVQHSKVNSRMGWLGNVVVSPHAHHIHHLKSPQYFNKNFSSDITLWDHLFGTFQYDAPLTAQQMEDDFGLSENDNPGGEKYVLKELYSATTRSLKTCFY